jgi:iron complex transport system substrate-binding protein
MIKLHFTKVCAFILCLIFLFSCHSVDNKKKGDTFNTENWHQVNLRYAKGFTMSRSGVFTLIKVRNPWQGAKDISFNYLLVPDSVKISSVPQGFELIRTPVRRIVCLSTTHIAFTDVLGEIESIVAISGSSLVSNPLLRKKIEDHALPDVGYEQNFNYELIVSLKPDMVMTYGVGSETTNQMSKLKQLGVKSVINAEYLEDTPLGKAEWIKFVSELYGKGALATTIFDGIEHRYINQRNKAMSYSNKPIVMCGLPWKDKWYVPGGQSYMSRLIEDAGGTYLWKNKPGRESIPLDIESVMDVASKADFWINSGAAQNYLDIIHTDPRLAKIRALGKNQVYNNIGKLSPTGGNDFWESGIVKPDVILSDLIAIFHPGNSHPSLLFYYKKLNK